MSSKVKKNKNKSFIYSILFLILVSLFYIYENKEEIKEEFNLKESYAYITY